MMSHGLMPLGVFPISLIAEYYGVGAAPITSGFALIGITLLVALFFAVGQRHFARGLDRVMVVTMD